MEKLIQRQISKKNLKRKFRNKDDYLSEKNQENIVDLGVLATDFSQTNQSMGDWQVQREKKGNVYKAFSEYILCLEDSLEIEDDSYKRYLIKQEIKKLKKEQKKYYVPSILEGARLDLLHEKDRKQSLEKSSYVLVKKIEEKFKN